MNIRLQYRNDTIDLTPHSLVLCHGGISQRIIIIQDDETICLLDWVFSGFYTRVFELAMLSCVHPGDDNFQQRLINLIQGAMNLTDEEQWHMKLILCVRSANLKWTMYETPHDCPYLAR